MTREAERRPPGRKSAAQTTSSGTRITAEQERVIRTAHHAMDLRGRGKSGVHTTTDACCVIRELLDVLAALTGIDSADATLPFQPGREA